jgi:hypothetical protein
MEAEVLPSRTISLQAVDDFAQRLLLARARGLLDDRLGQPFGAGDPHGVFADAGDLQLLLAPDLVCLMRDLHQAARCGVQEQPLERIAVIERGDQLPPLRVQLRDPALKVQELPALDAVQLLLERQHATCPLHTRAHAHPAASQPMKPIMKSRSDSPIVR